MTAALKRLPAFAGVPVASLDALAHLGDLVDLEPGHRLVRSGDWGHEAFLVVHGTADVIVDGAVVNRLTAGDVVGELAILDPLRTRTADVVAAGPVTAIVLDPRAYRSLRDLPGLEELLVRDDRYSSAA